MTRLLAAPAPEAALAPPPMPAAPVQAAPVQAAPESMPSLTLEDLQGAQDEALEGVEAEPPAGAPELAAEAEAGPDGASSGGNFASAKDAIEKLMGKAPAPPPPPSARMGGRSSMDVEATLDALETTLGGSSAPEPAPEPVRKTDLASTVRLTTEEIKVAMAAMGSQARPAEAVPPPAPPRPEPIRLATVTPPPAEAQGPDLLKIQLEQETCNNVTIEQMTAWIEQGRVHEYHLVARQFSEHWIEACKVPALRPVFDRMRKVRGSGDEFSSSSSEPQPAKRGLFGGLFGRS